MLAVLERLVTHHDAGVMGSAAIVLTLLIVMTRRSGRSGNRRTD